MTNHLEKLAARLLALDWKLYDIVVVPVHSLDIPSPVAQDGSAPADCGRTGGH